MKLKNTKFRFKDEMGILVEVVAKTELAARRKIRRIDRKLEYTHKRRGRLQLLDKEALLIFEKSN